jgi:hypothetical protein
MDKLFIAGWVGLAIGVTLTTISAPIVVACLIWAGSPDR